MASGHGWWRGFALLMLVLLVLPRCSAKFERGAFVSDKDMNKRKDACYVDIDNGMWGRVCRSSWIARENCALRCVSATCYNNVYREDPLEEGEVDFRRSRDYRTCLKRELQDQIKANK